MHGADAGYGGGVEMEDRKGVRYLRQCIQHFEISVFHSSINGGGFEATQCCRRLLDAVVKKKRGGKGGNSYSSGEGYETGSLGIVQKKVPRATAPEMVLQVQALGANRNRGNLIVGTAASS